VCSEGSTGGPRASLHRQMDNLRYEVRMRMSYPTEQISGFTRELYGMRQELQAQNAETQRLSETVAALRLEHDTLHQEHNSLQARYQALCQEKSLTNGWQITTAPVVALEIASPLDLGPATGAAPSGQPTNNTTAPADALEIASSLDLGPAGAKARRSKLAQPNSTRGDPPSPGSSQTTGMAAGAPDGVVNHLPALSTKTSGGSLTEHPLAAPADHGEIVTPSTGETPRIPRSASQRARLASRFACAGRVYAGPTGLRVQAQDQEGPTPQGTPPRRAGHGGPRGACAGVDRRSRGGR